MIRDLVWILISLFCLNRLILWIIFFKKRDFGVYGTIVIIVNHITSFSMPLVPQPKLELDIYLRVIGFIIFIFGIYIMKTANDEFHKMKIQPNTITKKLDTNGIYNIVRHPIYLGNNIYFVGWSLVWEAIYCLYFIPIIVFFNWLQAFLEEKYILIEEFGNEYEIYKEKVGMFIPKWKKIKLK